MKRELGMLLAALMLISLLAGCDIGGVPAPTGPNTESTQPTKNSESPVVGLPMPENPVGTWAEYDPDREYYILTGGVERTTYGGGRSFFKFSILSRRELDETDISVHINTKNSQHFEVYPYSANMRDTEYDHGSGSDYLPFRVFQHYYGVDFALAGKLYDWYLNPPEPGSSEDQEMKQITGGENVKLYFDRYVKQGTDVFAALTPEDTREFYLYNVWVYIEEITQEETLTQMDVTIEGNTFPVEFGTLNILVDEEPLWYPWGADDDWCGIVIPMGHFHNTLYSDGAMQDVFLYEAEAGKDMVLEELNVLTEGYEVLDLSVRITSGGNTVTTQWDGQSPIQLYEGDMVTINGVLRNEDFSALSYYAAMDHDLVYSVDGEKYSMSNQSVFEPNLNYHEVYAMIFDGVDMRPYYQDYYYRVYEQWRNEYN